MQNEPVPDRRGDDRLIDAIGDFCRMKFATIALATIAIGSQLFSASATEVPAHSHAVPVAFLGVRLQNDNEALEPTSAAERERQDKIQNLFKSKLESSGRFRFVPVPPEVRAKISSDQFIGECHGCEIDYGKQLSSTLIAWITVQKVSNLILNMNVYVADVSTNKMTFVHSVDVRGNTDESWTRSLSYLVDNYLLNSYGQ